MTARVPKWLPRSPLVYVLAGLTVAAVVSLAWANDRQAQGQDAAAALIAWGTFATAVATLLLAAFAGSAIIAASRDTRRSNRVARAASTMQFIYDWTREARQQSHELDDHLLAKGFSRETFGDFDDLSDEETRRMLRVFLEGVEHLAMGTVFGAYDQNIIYEITRARLFKLWARHEKYILALQNTEPTAYEHFQRLVVQLKARQEREDDERKKAESQRMSTPLRGAIRD